MHDSQAMEHWDGLALSQQLSEVCLDKPLDSLNQEEHTVADAHDVAVEDSVNLADNHEPHDYIGSQDFFCTPDFITPVEQQFSVDFDNKESILDQRSTFGLTPLRSKRPRPDTLHRQYPSTWLKEDQTSTHPEGPLVGDEGIPSTEKKSQLQGSSGYSAPISRARLTSMRRRVQSPVSIRNPFLQGVPEDNLDAFSKLRSQAHLSPMFGQNNVSRYREDFHEIQEIGHGDFSRVFKVLKRIDGALYAVKRTLHQLRLDSERRRALTEVQALAAVGAHENVVRYYTAWFENDYLYIQMELCDHNLTQLRASDPVASLECTLLETMRQIAKALSLIHSKGLVHLDLKPDNIYILNGIYKLGDFGRATCTDGSLIIEEGDGRYMPLEILNDDHSQLQKVDMFALGASIYELARGSPLPSSGPSFQALRQGKLTLLPGFSTTFQSLLKGLVNPNPVQRPTADELLHFSIFDDDICGSNLVKLS